MTNTGVYQGAGNGNIKEELDYIGPFPLQGGEVLNYRLRE